MPPRDRRYQQAVLPTMPCGKFHSLSHGSFVNTINSRLSKMLLKGDEGATLPLLGATELACLEWYSELETM